MHKCCSLLLLLLLLLCARMSMVCGNRWWQWCERKQFPIPIIYWKIDYYIENNFLLVKWTTISGSSNIIQSCHLTQSFRQQHTIEKPRAVTNLFHRIFGILAVWAITELKLHLIIFLRCDALQPNWIRCHLKFCTFLWIGFSVEKFTKYETCNFDQFSI